MERESEFHPGIPPENFEEQMAGLVLAIDNTKKKIAEYKTAGVDTTELESHLFLLEQKYQKISEDKYPKAA